MIWIKAVLKRGVTGRAGWGLWGLVAALGLLYLFSYRGDISPQRAEKTWRLPDSRFLTMAGGLRVHFRLLKAADKGAVEKTPMIFLHGSGSSLHSWSRWAEKLHGQRDVWLIDLPGAGLTGPVLKGKFDYTIRGYSQFLRNFMRESGIPKAVVAGHSVGGEIAWYFAGEHAEKVAGLVLVAPTGYPATPPLTWRIGKIPVLGWLLEKVTPLWIVKMNLHEAFAQDNLVTPRLVRRYQDLVRRAGNRRALRIQMRAARLEHWPRLARLTQPVLLLWGKKDIWLPSKLAARFVRDVKTIRLEMYENAGHALPEEKSGAVGDICRWLFSEESVKGKFRPVLPETGC